MRWGVFSDIHSNLEAAEAVIKTCRSEGIDSYLCLGDIVGYGANPIECIQLTREVSRIAITGNHDSATVGLFSLEYFNDWARKAVLWTRENIDSASRNFLASLKFDYKNKDLVLVHGSLNQPQEFNYMIDFAEASRTFSLMDRPICFVGHTHVAGVFIQDRQQRIDYRSEVNLKLKEDYRYIVNVGSIGQPRDGNHRASFAIFDSKKQMVSIKRVNYDINSAQEKIIAAGLPRFLAARLSQGR